jgi:hypothetical protein
MHPFFDLSYDLRRDLTREAPRIPENTAALVVGKRYWIFHETDTGRQKHGLFLALGAKLSPAKADAADFTLKTPRGEFALTGAVANLFDFDDLFTRENGSKIFNIKKSPIWENFSFFRVYPENIAEIGASAEAAKKLAKEHEEALKKARSRY